MDSQHSDDFFRSLVEILQGVCLRFLDFSHAVELSGYLCVEIDSKRKEVYVLRERIMRNGNVASESCCTHVFNIPMTISEQGLGRPSDYCVETRCVPSTNKHAVSPIDQPATRQDQSPMMIRSLAPQVHVPSRAVQALTSQTSTSVFKTPSTIQTGFSQTAMPQQPVPFKVVPGFSQTAMPQQPVPFKMLPGFSQTAMSQQPVPTKMLPSSCQTATSQKTVLTKMLPNFSQTAISVPSKMSQQPVPFIVEPQLSQIATSQQLVPSQMLPHSTQIRTSQQQVHTSVWPGSSQTATSQLPVPSSVWQGPSQIVTSDLSVKQDNSTEVNFSYVLAHPQQTPSKDTHKYMMNTRGPQFSSSIPDGRYQQDATQLISRNHRQTKLQTSLNQQFPLQPFPVLPNDMRAQGSPSKPDDTVDLASDSLMVEMVSEDKVTLSQSHVSDSAERQPLQDICPLQEKGPVSVPALRQLHCVSPGSIHCLAPAGQEKDLKLEPYSNVQKSVPNKKDEDSTNLLYVEIDSDDDDIIDIDLFDDDIDYSPSKSISDAGDKSECESNGRKRTLKNHVPLVEMMIKFHRNKTGKTVDLLSVNPVKLDCMLLEFFKGAVKQRGGGHLSPSTMRNTLSQMRTFLRDKAYSFRFTQSSLFHCAKQYISSLSKSAPIRNRFLPLDDSDIEILFQRKQLGGHSLLTLTYTMWFVNTRYLDLRTPAQHFNLKWGDVILKKDHQGQEFLARSVSPNLVHKVYCKPETPDRCFVNLYKQFRQGRPKLPLDESQPFYLKPVKQRKEVQNKFLAEALSIHFIRTIWKTMLISSGLPSNKKNGYYLMQQ